MESNQPTGTLEQVSNKSDEETKTIEEKTKNIEDKAKTYQEPTTALKNLEQTNQEETKESKKTNAEEAKDTDQKKITSVELNEQALNILSLFNNCSQIDKIMEKQERDKVLEFIRQIKGSSLIKILKGEKYEISTKRKLNAKKIIKKIQNSLENLKC